MKRYTWVMALVVGLFMGGLAIEDAAAGDCVLQATERVYLRTFRTSDDGVAQTDFAEWEGWLDSGMQTATPRPTNECPSRPRPRTIRPIPTVPTRTAWVGK